MSRWVATIFYRSEPEPIEVIHDLQELQELHDLVERGPSWFAIDRIEIRLQGQDGLLTLEQAERE